MRNTINSVGEEGQRDHRNDEQAVPRRADEKEKRKDNRQHGQNNQPTAVNKYFSAAESKTKKEALQRRVSSSCRRAVGPVPEYKVYGAVAQRDVSVQAMAKADQVKMVQPVTPQQLAIKAAFKLVGILTKGY